MLVASSILWYSFSRDHTLNFEFGCFPRLPTRHIVLSPDAGQPQRAPTPSQPRDSVGKQLTLYSRLFCQRFFFVCFVFDIVCLCFCVPSRLQNSNLCRLPLVRRTRNHLSWVSFQNMKWTLETKFKITAQLSMDISVLSTFKVG